MKSESFEIREASKHIHNSFVVLSWTRAKVWHTEERKLLNKVVIFVFFAHKVFLKLHNIKVEPLMSHGLF